MNKEEINSLAEAIVEKLIIRLQGQTGAVAPVMVDSTEAAKILCISRQYLLQIKDRFRYTKLGTNKQSRLMFYRADLLKELSGMETIKAK